MLHYAVQTQKSNPWAYVNRSLDLADTNLAQLSKWYLFCTRITSAGDHAEGCSICRCAISFSIVVCCSHLGPKLRQSLNPVSCSKPTQIVAQ